MELESTSEHAHELIHEHAAASHADRSSPGWFTQVALSTLVMALLSALAALLAAISAHESLLERTQEILDFVALDTERLEVEVLRSKHDVLRQLGEEPPVSEVSRVRNYEEEIVAMTKKTAADEEVVRTSTHAHVIFAIAVTLLSVGITLGGMAIISRKRFLWIVGLVFGAGGTLGVAIGLAEML